MAWVLHLVREKDGPELLRGPEKQSLGEPPCLRPRAWARHCAPQPPKLQDKQGGVLEKPGHVPGPQSWKGQNRVSLDPRPRVERGWPSNPASLSGLPDLEP